MDYALKFQKTPLRCLSTEASPYTPATPSRHLFSSVIKTLYTPNYKKNLPTPLKAKLTPEQIEWFKQFKVYYDTLISDEQSWNQKIDAFEQVGQWILSDSIKTIFETKQLFEIHIIVQLVEKYILAQILNCLFDLRPQLWRATCKLLSNIVFVMGDFSKQIINNALPVLIKNLARPSKTSFECVDNCILSFLKYASFSVLLNRIIEGCSNKHPIIRERCFYYLYGGICKRVQGNETNYLNCYGDRLLEVLRDGMTAPQSDVRKSAAKCLDKIEKIWPRFFEQYNKSYSPRQSFSQENFPDGHNYRSEDCLTKQEYSSRRSVSNCFLTPKFKLNSYSKLSSPTLSQIMNNKNFKTKISLLPRENNEKDQVTWSQNHSANESAMSILCQCNSTPNENDYFKLGGDMPTNEVDEQCKLLGENKLSANLTTDSNEYINDEIGAVYNEMSEECLKEEILVSAFDETLSFNSQVQLDGVEAVNEAMRDVLNLDDASFIRPSQIHLNEKDSSICSNIDYVSINEMEVNEVCKSSKCDDYLIFDFENVLNDYGNDDGLTRLNSTFCQAAQENCESESKPNVTCDNHNEAASTHEVAVVESGDFRDYEMKDEKPSEHLTETCHDSRPTSSLETKDDLETVDEIAEMLGVGSCVSTSSKQGKAFGNSHNAYSEDVCPKLQSRNTKLQQYTLKKQLNLNVPREELDLGLYSNYELSSLANIMDDDDDECHASFNKFNLFRNRRAATSVSCAQRLK